MSGEEMKVLGGWYSPFSFRVELALKLKGIPYEVIEQDLSNKSHLLLEHNPVYKKIPVLVHNGKPISESLVILEYIDDISKSNPILPQHPYHRATARFWAKFVDDKFTEAIKGILVSSEEEEEKKQVEKAVEALEVLEKELKQKGTMFFGGDKIGLVDVTLGLLNNWVLAVEELAAVKTHEAERFPFIEKWRLNFIEQPCVKEILPQQDKLVQYLRNFRRA
ncbi:probable glutathione S-transferase [Euphorbia lathyris]|uniref:probable glutathione S-transferase n=1 Tax=Euphorbia lathyris TaxID=212925 RepID=UPI0033132B6C